jgi:hypothetical protein
MNSTTQTLFGTLVAASLTFAPQPVAASGPTNFTPPASAGADALTDRANVANASPEISRPGGPPFRIINIAPLLAENKAGITEDLLRLHRDCGVTDVAFMLSLSPTKAEPTMAEAQHLRDLFLEMREPLRGSGLKIGILIQSTIGHGYSTDAKFDRIIAMDGKAKNCFCPLGSDFKKYILQAVATVVGTRPDFLLMDDDFRISHGDFDCFCPLHVAAFNEVAKGQYTRESLVQMLQREDAESRRLGRLWEEVRLASLAGLAREIRGVIDSVDPDLPCGLCNGGEIHFTAPLAKIFAGRQPLLVRIHNSWYKENDARGLLSRLYWTAASMEAFKGIPELLSESDTYEQNRYNTSAHALNGQITLSLLHGTTGAKLWITRMGEYEPGSGLAYREMLQHNIRRYKELRRLYPAISWDEPATPLPGQPVSLWNPPDINRQRYVKNWATEVCGRLGIPCRVAAGDRAVARTIMLTGPEVAFFTDAELKSFLSRNLLLDGPAAEQLCQRGFAESLGIYASRRGERVSLSVRSPRVQTISKGKPSPGDLTPVKEMTETSLALFENDLGGRVAVYAADIGSGSFLNETRREQLISVLGWLNRAPLPALVVSDVDIYARHGVVSPEAGGGELLCVFNMSMDALPELRLRVGSPGIKEISCLEGDGTWRKLVWHPDTGSELIVQTLLETMQPLILRLQR